MHDMGEHSSTLLEAVKLCNQARDLGSIMKFDITEQDRKDLAFCIERWEQEHETHELNHNANDVAIAKLILALTDKYHALVMNPPYMGGGNMNATLSKYVKDEYEEGKADMMTVFMVVAENHIEKNGKIGMITLPSWLFLSTFENLRKNIVANYHIDSLLHMGRGIFGIDWGSTAFVVSNCINHAGGTYFRLHKRNFQHIYYYHIEQLFLKALNNHNFKYDFDSYRDDYVVSKDIIFESSETGSQIYYPNVSQQDFEKIPGCPIGYWVSKKLLNIYEGNKISDYYIVKEGLKTGDNERFIRLWHEISYYEFNLKWFPHTKGGCFRRWYGNNDSVLNFENKGKELTNFKGSSVTGIENYFKKYITYGRIGSGKFSSRYTPEGFIPNMAGLSIVSDNGTNLYSILGISNSKLFQILLGIQNPTLNNPPGVIAKMPYLKIGTDINSVVSQNISISKQDWDAHETSWDFENNPLLAIDEETYIDNIHHEIERHEKETGEHICIDPAAPEFDSLEWRMEQYKQKWEHLFMQLHENEEELNRQFIDIYGLQDELTPDVPLDEITILQQGEISIENDRIKWQDDVVMKQFISYAVGCMMGRYRLDKKGLHIAHPNPTAEEIAPYIYNKVKFEIDEDGIIPLMPNDCGFSDNASNRFADFVRIALGDEKHVENLNFVEKCLGKSVEQYFVKDFWKDHKKMYQNRPIYWLFASKKGAFQCIAYMHRMNAYTAERIRAKYLLPYIETLQARITDLDARRSELTTRETKQLQQLTKTLEECQEYHDQLQVVAEQAIAFDLDDGVVVNYAKFGDVLQKIK